MASDRNWARVALLGVLAVLVYFAYLADERANRTERFARQAARHDLSDREFGAIKVIQMGALDWMRICAFTVGKDGGSVATMNKACSIKLGIGEPAWPREQKP